MQLFIIRHGQSANNVLEDESLRSYDPPLTDLGKQQADRLAQALAASHDSRFNAGSGFSGDLGANGFAITHLYCSAMYRSLQTAAPVARALGLKPEIWLDVHEQGGMYLDQDGGKVGYPGKTRPEILGEFPDYVLPETITDAGWYDVTRGYEEMHTGAGRAIKVAMELRRRAAGEYRDLRIAIITHGTFIDLMLKAFMGQLPNRQYYFSHYNTGITRLDITAEYVLIRYVDRIDHLPPDLIT
ncbi:MAG: histidine phosphatase family protein [Anaerolineae bacterium]